MIPKAELDDSRKDARIWEANAKEWERVATHLHDALAELVKANMEHDAAVETVIGRPPNWDDSYLDKARAALAGERDDA